MASVRLAFDEYYPEEGEEGGLCPIVLSHGLFWSKYMYKELAAMLADATHRKVVSLDLRNHGESPSSSEVSLQLMVVDVTRLLDERGLQRVVFVTHSMASTIAYEIALATPDRVEAMVMGDHPPFHTWHADLLEKVVLPNFEVQDSMLSRIDPDHSLQQARERFRKLATTASPAQSLFLNKAAYDLRKRDGKFEWRHDMRFLIERYKQRAFVPDAHGSSRHRILIVRCQDSLRVTDKKFAEIFRHNPNAELLTFEDTTHNLILEEKEKFCRTVAEFLQKQTRPANAHTETAIEETPH